MLGDRFNMVPITHPTEFRHRQHALIDRAGAPPALRFLCHCVWFKGRRSSDVPGLRVGWLYGVDPNGLKPRLEGLLEDLGIFGGEAAAGADTLDGASPVKPRVVTDQLNWAVQKGSPPFRYCRRLQEDARVRVVAP